MVPTIYSYIEEKKKKKRTCIELNQRNLKVDLKTNYKGV